MIRSLKYRIALTIFLLEAIMLAIVLWRYQLVADKSIREQMDTTHHMVVEMVGEVSRYALINTGYDELQNYIEKLRMDPQIQHVLIADYRNRVVASSDYTMLGRMLPSLNDGPDHYWRKEELTNASGRLGIVAIDFSSSGLVNALKEARKQGAFIALSSMLLIAMVGLGIGILLTRRLEKLQIAAHDLAQGDLNTRVSVKGDDEVTALANTFNKMADQINSSITALRRSKEEWEKTFDSIHDIITIQDRDMRIVRANRAAHEAFQVQPGGLNGRHCYEVFRGTNELCPNCPQLLTLQENKTHTGNITHENLGKTFLVTSSPMLNRDGEFTHLIHIAKDITGYKKMEAELFQSRKMEAIGTLAGGIAHDFNNILSAILGYADLARDEIPQGSPTRNYLDQVLKAGHRAKELVKQILTFSRKGQETPQPMRPSSIIKEALKLMRASLPTTIDIHEEIAPDCGIILASPTNIHQVVVNLCTNAFHAMENEQGVLNVKLTRMDLKKDEAAHRSGVSAGAYVELLVKDTGCGMDKATMDRIFEPYFTTKDIGKGTGLGLALVHGIVQDCRGFIRVESEPGKGSAFHLYFPVIEEKPAKAEEEKPEILPRGNERVLAVDDEKVIVDICKARLERMGYTVTTYCSSKEALAAFRSSPDSFDLVITDQTMPHLPGSALAKELLQIRPNIPIILCSGYSSMVSEERAIDLGIRKFAMKPVSPRDLAMMVRDVLDRQ